MYGVDDLYDAFRFDRAVIHFGESLSNALESIEGKNSREVERKRLGVLRKWIPEASAGPSSFRDPAKE